ncbi:MAG: ATP-binding cassette domain-containing protein [Alicyclobacillus sp.]|nr:ATP-binding cassette domain-containing protein [Alicyclobacillus sp.]
MPVLQVENLVIEYGTSKGTYKAVDDVSFSIRSGEFISIVGPSGAGKSTLLKAIAGLFQVTNSSVTINWCSCKLRL